MSEIKRIRLLLAVLVMVSICGVWKYSRQDHALSRSATARIPVAIPVPRSPIPAAPVAPSLLSAPVPSSARVTLCAQPVQAPSWTVTFGGEFWRQPIPDVPVAARPHQPSAVPLPAGLNLHDVMARVRHALVSETSGDGARLHSQTYDAGVNSAGVWIFPRQSGADTHRRDCGPLADCVCESCGRTRLSIRPRPGRCLVRFGQHPRRRLLEPQSGLLAHYEMRTEGVALTWVLPQPLPGNGPLAVTLECVRFELCRSNRERTTF